MIELPDPTSPPNKMDMLSHGADCARHPLIGCVIANNGVPPGVQARNFLISLRDATFHEVAGRAGDLSDTEFRDLWCRLESWEAAGNSVPMPTQIVGHPFALGRDAERERQAYQAERYRLDRIESERRRNEAEQRLHDAEAAMAERKGKPVH